MCSSESGIISEKVKEYGAKGIQLPIDYEDLQNILKEQGLK